MLYELNIETEKALNKYYECFDENGEIISEEEFEKVNKELLELQNKSSDLIEWQLKKRANTQWEVLSIDNEIKRLNELKTKKQKDITKSENFIEMMTKKDYSGKAINISNWQVNYRKSSIVVVEDETKIPKELLKYTPEKVVEEKWSIDKNILKKALKNEEIDWAYIQDKITLKIT